MKFNIICCDIPWTFNDKLSMSEVKRGAESQYSVLDQSNLIKLPVKEIVAEDSLLCLWVPSSLLKEGLEIMNAWGFRQTQTFVWVKTKKNPLKDFVKELYKDFTLENFTKHVSDFNLNNSLAFFMGHLFRQTHEICLIGVKGKIYNKLKNKSQRSVCLDVSLKHSAKTEILQDRLDLMFPEESKLEMFARRQRQGWTCIGNEVDGPDSNGEDIFVSIEALKNLSV
jgi:N6-adenosine-specific RNA methylase IME4